LKALSVRQPWASLIAHGHKTLEIRTWGTAYRGDLLICSAARRDEINYSHTIFMGPHDWPTGVAMAIVTLADVRWMTADDEQAACHPWYQNAKVWVLKNPRLVEPRPVTGRLGLFESGVIL